MERFLPTSKLGFVRTHSGNNKNPGISLSNDVDISYVIPQASPSSTSFSGSPGLPNKWRQRNRQWSLRMKLLRVKNVNLKWSELS